MGIDILGNYMYGSPGSGKTFLMDLFYDTIDIKEKERVHFNEFMLNIHSTLHILEVILIGYSLIEITRSWPGPYETGSVVESFINPFVVP
jgi:predicted ATPase